MAKPEIDIEVRQCGRVIDRIRRVVVRGCVIYRAKMWPVADGVVTLPDDGIPHPDDPIVPLDEELARRLAWFIGNRSEISWTLKIRNLFVTDDPDNGIVFEKGRYG